MSNKKRVSIGGKNQISPEEKKNKAKSPTTDDGYAGNLLIEGIPRFNKTKSEQVYAGSNNSWIVLGRDRPGSKQSGYINNTQAGAIDIVVGRMAYRSTSYIRGKYVYTDPNFKGDAARIYISQKTNIDDNFGLVAGSVGNPKPRSGIALKADGVRIIAREGIKLVTKTDSKNSQGGEMLDSVFGIDLLATNDDSLLEPIPKGNKLVEALTKIVTNIDKLNGIVDSFLQYQVHLNSVITHHTHTSPGKVIPVPGGVIWETNPSIPVMSEGMKTAMNLLATTKKSFVVNKINLGNFQNRYLSPMGDGYINSYFNNTT